MPRVQPRETADKPIASWSSGKEVARSDRVFRGWFLDTGLDEALDAAATAAGWPMGGLSHLDGAVREHWLLPSPTPLFVLIAGVPYTRMASLTKNDVSYAGIGCRWPMGGRSALGVQCLHPDLIAQGYVEPLAFRVSSTQTDDLLAALLAHNAVLDACEAAAARKGTPRTFEFWEIAISLAPGDKVQRGKGQTSPVSPIICTHPAEPPVEYLRSLWAPSVVRSVVEARWGEIEAWAKEFAERVYEAEGMSAPAQ